MDKLILNSIVKVSEFEYHTKIGSTKLSNDINYEVFNDTSEVLILNNWKSVNNLEHAWAIPIDEKTTKFLEKNSHKGFNKILKNIWSYRTYSKEFLDSFDDKYVLYINEANLVK